jgi:hypothetical protein
VAVVAPQNCDGEDLVLHSGSSKFRWPPEDEGERRASRELRVRSQAGTTPPSTRAAAAPWGRAGCGFRGRRRGRPQDGRRGCSSLPPLLLSPPPLIPLAVDRG